MTEDFILQCLKPLEEDRIGWDKIFMHPVFGDFFKGTVKEI